MTDQQIENTFTYHRPAPDQVERYAKLREQARAIAYLIQYSCPDSREKSLALTSLQQTVMWANAAIAVNEPDADQQLEKTDCRSAVTIQPGSYFDYLAPLDGPVVPGLEDFEVVFAKNQPQYTPLRALPSRHPDGEGKVVSRWTLTEQQRLAVLSGADIFLSLLTFGTPLQPILMAIGRNPNPYFFRLDLGYPLPKEQGCEPGQCGSAEAEDKQFAAPPAPDAAPAAD